MNAQWYFCNKDKGFSELFQKIHNVVFQKLFLNVQRNMHRHNKVFEFPSWTRLVSTIGFFFYYSNVESWFLTFNLKILQKKNTLPTNSFINITWMNWKKRNIIKERPCFIFRKNIIKFPFFSLSVHSFLDDNQNSEIFSIIGELEDTSNSVSSFYGFARHLV